MDQIIGKEKQSVRQLPIQQLPKQTQKSTETIKKYNNVLKLLGEKDIDIKNYNQVTNHLTTNGFSLSYNKVILSAIIYQLKLDNQDNKELIKKYLNIIAKIREVLTEKMDNHVVNYEIKKWEDIVKMQITYQLNYRGTQLKKHMVIIALYTYIPPRRVRDYSLMKWVIDLNEANDINSNYFVKNAGALIYNNYKTKKKFKQQIIKAPQSLKETIDDYVEENGINSGDSLLGLSDSGLNYCIIRIFGGGVDMLRRSFVDYRFKDNELPKNVDLKRISDMMGHNLDTHLAYRKESLKK